MNNQFSSTNKIAKCRVCGKLTHSSINGDMSIELCRPCYDAAGVENEHLDGHHEGSPKKGCPNCSEYKGRPEEGKQYALTGAPGEKCIANGNTWAESEVVPMAKFLARWFRNTSGRYLTLEESDRSVTMIAAPDKETAIEMAKEREQEDSSIPFLDRVSVWKV